jgi:hypothetical protein
MSSQFSNHVMQALLKPLSVIIGEIWFVILLKQSKHRIKLYCQASINQYDQIRVALCQLGHY